MEYLRWVLPNAAHNNEVGTTSWYTPKALPTINMDALTPRALTTTPVSWTLLHMVTRVPADQAHLHKHRDHQSIIGLVAEDFMLQAVEV